jgi:predicted Rossmann fold flavoprotein
MLFTEKGISGPLVLSASAHLDQTHMDDILLSIDLKPALTQEQLDARILRDFGANSNKAIKNTLGLLLPSSMVPVMLDLCGIDGEKPCNQVNKAERRMLLQMLKGMPLSIAQIGPIEQAIITRGGVALKEIDPKTMGSKLVKNLYFAGEILDLDAYTGGYNLQIAFTTGYAAGNFCEII